MVKLQADGTKQFKVTLPKTIVQAIGWKKGETLLASINEKGEVILKKIEALNLPEKINSKR